MMPCASSAHRNLAYSVDFLNTGMGRGLQQYYQECKRGVYFDKKQLKNISEVKPSDRIALFLAA